MSHFGLYVAEAECGYIFGCQQSSDELSQSPSLLLCLLINHSDKGKALLDEGHCL